VTAVVASLAVLGVALPHVLRLDRARPVTAATLWMAALTLRALAAISFALYVVVVFPDTEAFKLLTHWCKHAVMPAVDIHFDVQGHAVGAAVALVPIVAAGGALLVAAGRTARTARAVDEMLRSRALGAGPGDSVIVGGPEVVVAASGLLHPKVVVTAGALAMLEDDELARGPGQVAPHAGHHCAS